MSDQARGRAQQEAWRDQCDMPVQYLGDESEDESPYVELIKSLFWCVVIALAGVAGGVFIGVVFHIYKLSVFF